MKHEQGFTEETSDLSLEDFEKSENFQDNLGSAISSAIEPGNEIDLPERDDLTSDETVLVQDEVRFDDIPARRTKLCQQAAALACASCALVGECPILKLKRQVEAGNLQPQPDRDSYLDELLADDDQVSVVVAGYAPQTEIADYQIPEAINEDYSRPDFASDTEDEKTLKVTEVGAFRSNKKDEFFEDKKISVFETEQKVKLFEPAKDIDFEPEILKKMSKISENVIDISEDSQDFSKDLTEQTEILPEIIEKMPEQSDDLYQILEETSKKTEILSSEFFETETKKFEVQSELLQDFPANFEQISENVELPVVKTVDNFKVPVVEKVDDFLADEFEEGFDNKIVNKDFLEIDSKNDSSSDLVNSFVDLEVAEPEEEPWQHIRDRFEIKPETDFKEDYRQKSNKIYLNSENLKQNPENNALINENYHQNDENSVEISQNFELSEHKLAGFVIKKCLSELPEQEFPEQSLLGDDENYEFSNIKQQFTENDSNYRMELGNSSVETRNFVETKDLEMQNIVEYSEVEAQNFIEQNEFEANNLSKNRKNYKAIIANWIGVIAIYASINYMNI